MDSILDTVKIKFDLLFKGNTLAKVTLNFQDEFEIRYCRITLRQNNTLWFQPPSLKEYGYVKCFAVLNRDQWRKLEERVVNEFTILLKEKETTGDISPAILQKIRHAHAEQNIDIDEIDKGISPQNKY